MVFSHLSVNAAHSRLFWAVPVDKGATVILHITGEQSPAFSATARNYQRVISHLREIIDVKAWLLYVVTTL